MNCSPLLSPVYFPGHRTLDRIRNAVIIHGTGRSGTTLFSDILSMHPDFFWISNFVDRYPETPAWSVFNRMYRIPGVESFTRGKRFFPRPTEPYGFWDHFFPGFRNGKVTESDPEKVKRCIRSIEGIGKYQGGKRFINKLTGKSRSEALDAVFDTPTILWIDRDPRAVVMSYYKQLWNYKRNPDAFAAKSTSDLIREYCAMFIEFQKDKEGLKQFNCISLSYEKMMEDPVEFFHSVLDTLGMSRSEKFDDFVRTWKIRPGTFDAYKGQLNEEELALLNSLLAPYLD